MKIQVLSDIHVEFRADKPFQIPPSDAHVIVLAGDIGEGLQGITWAADQSQRVGKQVVYVPGNHEYYNQDITRHDDAMRKHADALGVAFLNEDVFDYGGVRFVGATLWTSFKNECGKDDWFAMDQARRGLADYHLIRRGSTGLHPRHTQVLHASASQFIEKALDASSPDRTVVVTHHAPSHRCTNPDFPFGTMTRAFSSSLDNLLGKSAAWTYGHTHACFYETINGTQVISNQLGYPGERNHGFDPNKVIEI